MGVEGCSPLLIAPGGRLARIRRGAKAPGCAEELGAAAEALRASFANG